MKKVYDLKIPAVKAGKLDLSAILNAEKLLHLHPHWTVDECREQDNGFVFASLTDYETDNEFQIGLRLDLGTSVTKDRTDSRTVLALH